MSTWQMLEYLFDQIPYMATIMVDKEGKVIFINKTYLRILKLSKRSDWQACWDYNSPKSHFSGFKNWQG